jgi:phosphoglycerate dehydrogenase-like enzyme
VQTLYTGVDAFPFDHLPPKARVAGNIGAYAPFVAEHAVALCLALARRLPEGHRQLASGSLRPTPMLTFLGGKTALVVGYGEIAEEIARRLKGLGMRVVGVNRSGELRPGVDRMLPIGRLLEGLPGAAVVIDCLPLTRETRGLFGSEAMEAIAPDGIFVNVGRAETVEPAALKARLDRGGGFRAGLDVWWNEDFSGGTVPLPFDVGAYPTLIASPHNAGFVPEARRFVLERALSNLARHFRGETPLHLEDRSRYEKGP